MTELLVLCTGNAARSVMAGFMLETLEAARGGTDLHIVTGGTHTVDGQPMGLRTRSALKALPELADVDFRRHRSRQVGMADLVRADLVVVMEADHVRFVRRHYPEAADRTATIRRLCEDLPPGPPSLAERVAALALADGDTLRGRTTSSTLPAVRQRNTTPAWPSCGSSAGASSRSCSQAILIPA